MPIRVGNAPVSWGIYEFEELEQKYPFTQVLDEIKDTGYNGLELGPWGYLPTEPNVLRPELNKRGLQLLSSYVPVQLKDAAAHNAGREHALKVGRLLAALGANYIVLADDNGTDPELVAKAGQRKGSWLSSSEWNVFGQGVNMIARAVNDELGLKVVFHHHCAGHVETPEETAELLERADERLVGLCLDTGHWHYAGGDALECVRTYGERVRYLHLKDCDPNIRALAIKEGLNYFAATQAGVFCELGEGEVDFPGIIDAVEALGYNGWAIVEQDVLTTDLDAPRQSARRNREYLRTLGI